jgi:hypothetical protein
MLNLNDVGIDAMRGGCAIVVSGQLIKNEPWSMTDEKSGEYREGYSFHVAYFGGVYKVKVEADDPLRKLAVGSSINLLIPVASTGVKLVQAGPAKQIQAAASAKGAA